MLDYDELTERRDRNYAPYLMFFNRCHFTSTAVNTDRSGFRISTGRGDLRASAAEPPVGGVRIVAGASGAFGAGASSDSNTLASLLWSRYAPSAPWLNFGGYAFNPAQEALLFALYRPSLGDIDEVVIFSGYNALMLARLPEWQQGDHGAFFRCAEYFEKMDELRRRQEASPSRRHRQVRLSSRTTRLSATDDLTRDMPTVIGRATRATLRQLEVWKRLAGPGAQISYVLQPTSMWMRPTLTPQEELLFAEQDYLNTKMGRPTWNAGFGDISTPEVGAAFARSLADGCTEIGVPFLDLNALFANVVAPDEWIFVDRVHLNDSGYDLAARLLAKTLELR